MDSQLQTQQRAQFIDRVHQEFLVMTGYGAHVHINTHGILMLFNQFLNQPRPEREFIRAAITSLKRA